MNSVASNNINNNNNINNGNHDSSCKIFVGGLTWNTTKEMLANEFIKYGEIVDSIVIKNPETGNSRGFGFVTFRTSHSALRAVDFGAHTIDFKSVDVKLCDPPGVAKSRNAKQRADNCKVFVGGLPHGVTDEEIKQLFSRYGIVKDFKMKYDENKQRPRGFGFVTFESEESANLVLQEHYIQYNGKQIEVKPQKHNLRSNMSSQQHQQQLQQQHQLLFDNHQQQQHHMLFDNQQQQQPLQPQQHQQFGISWNQSWNPSTNQQTSPVNNIGTGWGGATSAYNAIGGAAGIAGLAQSWGGYQGGSASHTLPSSASPYANNSGNNGSLGGGTNAGQSNWNYNYYA